MRIKALNEIGEICFAIHPVDVNYEKGHFELKGIKIGVWLIWINYKHIYFYILIYCDKMKKERIIPYYPTQQ